MIPEASGLQPTAAMSISSSSSSLQSTTTTSSSSSPTAASAASTTPSTPVSCPPLDDSNSFVRRWTWDSEARSHEVRLDETMEAVQFHPNWSNGTAAVRGKMRLNGGKHYWEVRLQRRVFGTAMMVGIGTDKARLHADAFVNMLGEDHHGWGLSHKGKYSFGE